VPRLQLMASALNIARRIRKVLNYTCSVYTGTPSSCIPTLVPAPEARSNAQMEGMPSSNTPWSCASAIPSARGRGEKGGWGGGVSGRVKPHCRTVPRTLTKMPTDAKTRSIKYEYDTRLTSQPLFHL